MSLFHTMNLPCPACGAETTFEAVHSVNADRRPDLRSEILAGEFQKEPCPKCGKTFRLQPAMTYMDLARGQWIGAFGFDRLGEWQTVENEAHDAFDKAFGNLASPAAREIGQGLKPRVTFGWAALAEKILAADRRLGDADLELVKIAVLRNADSAPLTNDTELRLTEADDQNLRFDWIVTATEQRVEGLGVSLELYDEIAADQEGWKELRDQISAGLFVDMQRLMIESHSSSAK